MRPLLALRAAASYHPLLHLRKCQTLLLSQSHMPKAVPLSLQVPRVDEIRGAAASDRLGATDSGAGTFHAAELARGRGQ